MPEADREPEVLILAPLAADGRALQREAEACGLVARSCRDSLALSSALAVDRAAGTLFVVVSQEGADARTGAALQDVFNREPSWSSLPALFLVSDATRPPPAARIVDRTVLTLERPAKRTILHAIFQMLAEARRRQYETRDLLESLAAGERRQSFLLSELHHRVGNNLAMLQAMFMLSARRAASLDDLVSAFSDRLNNFARAHAALSQEESDSRDLSALVRDLVEPYCQRPEQLVLNGPAVRLRGRLSFEMAVVMHELATNAAKYGALSVDAGTVEVEWRREGEIGELQLVWSETGGPPVEPPARQGLGSALIKSFAARGVTAAHEFHQAGLVWRVRLPAASIAVVDDPVPAASGHGL